MNVLKNAVLILVCGIFLSACTNKEATIPDNSKAKIASYIVSPGNGQTVSSPVRVIFGLKGMGIAPAGINFPDTGHHHLLIDLDKLPDLTQALPAADNLIHFGKGQTETLVELSPGTHTLQLLLADFMHVPHAEPIMSEKITITVK